MTKALKVVSNFEPAGSQPDAIKSLVGGLEDGLLHQTLLGVTGSGKTLCPVLPSSAQNLHWLNEDPANTTYSVKQLESSFSNTRDNLYKLIKKFMIMNVQ